MITYYKMEIKNGKNTVWSEIYHDGDKAILQAKWCAYQMESITSVYVTKYHWAGKGQPWIDGIIYHEFARKWESI